MTPALRQRLINLLAENLISSMFGDGFEEQYVKDGMDFKGLNHMTEEELVNELEMAYPDPWTVTEEELIDQVGDPGTEWYEVYKQLVTEHPTKDTLTTE